MAEHRHTPSRFVNNFGGGSPVLRVRHGDTVETSTLDAHGFDGKGRQAAEKDNPLTGPFYVEGAEPGDTLSVLIESLRPSRATGWTRAFVAPHVVEPEFVPRLGPRDFLEWEIDLPGGKLVPRDARVARHGFVFPLAPMLGCIGVAPSGKQEITSMSSGPHGGNMDYNGCRAGATLSFPVFAEGALLYVGDGHACQGDGEIAGTGVETSFDVRFTVGLRKGKAISWPRGEDGDQVFTLGNARPLEEALQHATTEMLAWLEEDFGLDLLASGVLMGCAVKYDVGNVFDPAYTVACRIPKTFLPARVPR